MITMRETFRDETLIDLENVLKFFEEYGIPLNTQGALIQTGNLAMVCHFLSIYNTDKINVERNCGTLYQTVHSEFIRPNIKNLHASLKPHFPYINIVDIDLSGDPLNDMDKLEIILDGLSRFIDFEKIINMTYGTILYNLSKKDRTIQEDKLYQFIKSYVQKRLNSFKNPFDS